LAAPFWAAAWPFDRVGVEPEGDVLEVAGVGNVDGTPG